MLPVTDDAQVALIDIHQRLAREGIRPSNRRFRQVQVLAQAAAWLDGAAEAGPEHLEPTVNAFWEAPEQCQPPGTLVMVVRQPREAYGKRQGIMEEVAIENVNVGDRVVAYDINGHLHVNGRTVTQTAQRQFAGGFVAVKVGDAGSRYTPDHHCVVRVGDSLRDHHLVYLQRRGDSFRVGRTGTKGVGGRVGPMERAGAQHADAMWILSQHDTQEEAMVAESMTSHRFGIPTWLFELESRRPTAERTIRVLNSLWSTVGDLTNQAQQCLASHGRLLRYPFWSRQPDHAAAVAHRTTSMFHQRRPTVIRACNLLDGMQMLRVWEEGQSLTFDCTHHDRWTRHPTIGSPNRRLRDVFDERYFVAKRRRFDPWTVGGKGHAPQKHVLSTQVAWDVIDLASDCTVSSGHATMRSARTWVEASLADPNSLKHDVITQQPWLSQQWLPITVTREPTYGGSVYSLEVEHDHTYVADGLVTHNCGIVAKAVIEVSSPAQAEVLEVSDAVGELVEQFNEAMKIGDAKERYEPLLGIQRRLARARKDIDKLRGRAAGRSLRLVDKVDRELEALKEQVVTQGFGI